MKIGEKVRVISINQMNKGQVSVGDEGKIVDLGCDLVFVLLNKYVNANIMENPYLFRDRSYQLGKNQVEVI